MCARLRKQATTRPHGSFCARQSLAEHDTLHAVGYETKERLMSNKTLSEIAKDMAGIDIAILSTHTEGGQIANRPMSNNRDVTYDGTSYYFTYEQARVVSD